MRSCESIDPLVTPYIDRELPDADRHAVDEHLRACPPCHSRVAAERAVRNLVHTRQPQLSKPDAPRALHTRCAALAADARTTSEAPDTRLGVARVAAAVADAVRAPAAV